jgi:hypothetical protein
MTVGWTKKPLESSHSPPNHTRARFPALRAPSIASFSFSNDAASITAPMKFLKSRTSPTRTCDSSEGEPLLQRLPQRARHVGAARRRALLTLVFERTAHERHGQRCHVGRGMREDEVLAARLAHESRVLLVARDLRADLAPDVLKTPVEPVKCRPASRGSDTAGSPTLAPRPAGS